MMSGRARQTGIARPRTIGEYRAGAPDATAVQEDRQEIDALQLLSCWNSSRTDFGEVGTLTGTGPARLQRLGGQGVAVPQADDRGASLLIPSIRCNGSGPRVPKRNRVKRVRTRWARTLASGTGAPRRGRCPAESPPEARRLISPSEHGARPARSASFARGRTQLVHGDTGILQAVSVADVAHHAVSAVRQNRPINRHGADNTQLHRAKSEKKKEPGSSRSHR